MKEKSKIYLLILLSIIFFNFFITSCSTSSSNNNYSYISSNSNNQTTIAEGTPNDNVKVLDDNTLNEIQQISFENGGEIVLNSDSVNIEQNQVLVAKPSTSAPNGFLRKVEQVRKNKDGTITITTSQADLTDLFKEANIKTNVNLTADNCQFTTTLNYKTLKQYKNSNGTFTISINDLELYIQGKKILVDITLSVSPNFDININIDSLPEPTLKYFLLKCNLNATQSITFHNEYSLSKSKKWKIGQINSIQPITIMVGAVPLVIKPKIELFLKVEPQVSVGFEVTPQLSETITAGVKYQDNKWSTISDFSYNFDCNANITGDAYVKVGIGPKFELLFYGVIGPYIYTGPYVKLEAETSTQNLGQLDVYIKGGIEATGGVHAEVLGKTIADKEFPVIISYEYIIKQWSYNFYILPVTNFNANYDPANNAVNLSWTYSDTNKNIVIERSINGLDFEEIYNQQFDPQNNEFTDLLPQGTDGYVKYRIKSQEGSSYSSWTYKKVNINPPPQPINPGEALIENLNATYQLNGLNKITITWTNNSNNTKEFIIKRLAPYNTEWVTVGRVSKNTTSFTDNVILQTGEYYYSVQAANDYGLSDDFIIMVDINLDDN